MGHPYEYEGKSGYCVDCNVAVVWKTKRRWYCDECREKREKESEKSSRKVMSKERKKEIIRQAKARKYRLTLAEMDDILEGGCDVCTEGEACIDHDPITGKVRGALCHADNMTLGKLLDDPKRLRRLASYLESTASTYQEVLAATYRMAHLSPDPSTQIGSVLCHRVGDTLLLPIHQTAGYNRPVDGWIMEAEDWGRPRKYSLLEHSERNSIFAAAKHGIPTEGLTMVASWAACSDCARAIVSSGIRTLIRHYPPDDEATSRWLESVEIGDLILKSGGVEVTNVHGRIPETLPVLRGGKLFYPDLMAISNRHNELHFGAEL